METKYRLLKDLPDVKAGTVYRKLTCADLPSHVKEEWNIYAPEGLWTMAITEDRILENPDWFEVKEE